MNILKKIILTGIYFIEWIVHIWHFHIHKQWRL